MQRLNVSAGPKGSRRTIYTRPSKPGEYPRKRTGFGQASVMLDTHDVNEIARTLRVRVGYQANAHYMPILELYRDRKGLIDTLKDLRPQLEALASA